VAPRFELSVAVTHAGLRGNVEQTLAEAAGQLITPAILDCFDRQFVFGLIAVVRCSAVDRSIFTTTLRKALINHAVFLTGAQVNNSLKFKFSIISS
jgi:hypothetical protein